MHSICNETEQVGHGAFSMGASAPTKSGVGEHMEQRSNSQLHAFPPLPVPPPMGIGLSCSKRRMLYGQALGLPNQSRRAAATTSAPPDPSLLIPKGGVAKWRDARVPQQVVPSLSDQTEMHLLYLLTRKHPGQCLRGIQAQIGCSPGQLEVVGGNLSHSMVL